MVEAIAGRMRTDEAYGLDAPVPMVQAEQSDEMKALIKQMQTPCPHSTSIDSLGQSHVSKARSRQCA